VVAVLSDLDAGRNRLKPKAKEALQAVTVCAYCKRRGTLDRGPDDLYWHMDHILPWSVEQLERLDNYVKACHSCNIKKGNRTVYPDPDAFTGASKKFRNTELYQKLVEAGKIDPTPVIAPQ
jgi:5-methylcytosine-specific restriction endonuclease McrA